MGSKRHLIVTVVVTILAIVTSTLSAMAASPQKADRATHIVMLRPDAFGLEVAMAHGATVTSQFTAVFNGFAANVPAGRLQALERDPRVLVVEPNASFEIQQQTLPAGVNRIDADHNPYAGIDSVDQRVNVVVAVMDTGVYGIHKDLNVNVSKSVDCTTSGSPCAVGVAIDPSGHGTHVAGTIGALDNGMGVVGVAPGAEIWSVRVCNGSCTLEAILKGHEYVSLNAGQIAVANMSLGGKGWSESWHAAVKDNVNKGVVVVVSAGNSKLELYGGDGAIGNGNEYQPAAYPETMAVSAIGDTDGQAGGFGMNTSDGADDTLASFSNYSTGAIADNPVSSPGGGIDIAAPGVDIISTANTGTYTTKSGTSMAAPHVAGSVALYIAEHGRATSAAGVANIRQVLINASQSMASWRPDDLAIASDRDASHEGLVNASGGEAAPVPGPSPLRDAAVVGIDTPAGLAQGELVHVNVTVSNNGTTDETFPVALQAISPSGAAATAGTQSVMLAAGDTATVSFAWDTTVVEAGEHTLVAETQLTDDDQLDNNQQQTTITVLQPLVDVVVDQITAPTTVLQGETVTVAVTVMNNGHGSATLDLALRDIGPAGSAWPVDTETVTISAGASTVVEFAWNTDGADAGTHMLETEALLAGDTNQGDNLRQMTVTVQDFIKDAVLSEIVAPASLMHGETGSVSVTVRNDGNGEESFLVALRATDPGGTVMSVDSTMVGLAAGESTVVVFNWNTSGLATGILSLEAVTQLSDDDRPDNDRQQTPVEIYPPVTDVAVSTLIASPSAFTQGSTVRIDLMVENAGNQNVTNDFTVTLINRSDDTLIGTQVVSGGLATGATRTITFSWNTSGITPGDVILVASHDMDDDNLNNNMEDLIVSVSPPPATMVHAGDLDAQTAILTRNKWSAAVTILAIDNFGAPVAGAMIDGTFQQGKTTWQVICTSDASGRCLVESGTLTAQKVVFTIARISHASLTYDPIANSDPDGDSNGTTIMLTK